VFSVVVGIPLGVLAGMKPRRGIDGGARGLALLGQTIPDFWLALVLILVFAVKLDWFPPFGRETFQLGPLDLPNHSIILPAFALCLFPMAQLLRFTRSSVLEIVGEDYVRIARSKGIPSRLIYRRHILKNALIPLISILSLQVGALLSGSLYIEAVFSWPGAGGLLAEAVGNRDFPLVQGLAFLGGLITIFFSLLADVLYQLADPRIRLGSPR
jgi:peptide/nickel transport system permease protein